MTDQPQEKTAVELFGDGAAARTTRDRLLHTAMNLFYSQGFHAVGVDRVIAEVGVTKTTFYNHFESKDQLIAEVMKVRDEWERRNFEQAVDSAGDTSRDRLLAAFDLLDEWFTSEDFRGCMFINAAAEFPNPHDPIHAAAGAHLHAIRDHLRNTARRAGAADPDSLADELTLLMEGAITVRMVACDDNAAATARRLAKRVVDASLPAQTD